MSEMAPLLPILLVWLCFGLLFRKLQSAAKKAQPANKKAVSPKPDSPAEKKPSAPVPDSSLASMQGSLPIAERLSQPYRGSLDVETGEGEDPCHEEQFQNLDRLRAVSALQDEDDGDRRPEGLNLSWAGNDIVRGFVYGEILNRKKH